MSQAYKDVIDLLTQEFVDYRKLVIAIAKENPEAVMRAVYLGAARPAAWAREAAAFIKANNPVHAIKQIRIEHGLGLKEAKDIVDTARLRMQDLGRMTIPLGAYVSNPPVLPPCNDTICSQIVAASAF